MTKPWHVFAMMFVVFAVMVGGLVYVATLPEGPSIAQEANTQCIGRQGVRSIDSNTYTAICNNGLAVSLP